MASLTCGFWNIHGFKSQLIGNKLNDPEFLDILSSRDVIGLGEIHSEGEVSIPGFLSKKQKIREKKFKGPKIAGGIGVFVREEVDHLVQVVDNNNDDSIWIKIKKQVSTDEDVYLGTYYVSPDNSQSRKNYDFFTAINDEVAHFSKKGIVLLQGDLNGRTGEDKDYVEADKSDETLCIENFDNQNMRNSEDKTKNPRGNQLLDICKLNDMLILNGRTTGDIFGKFTCHNWNGSSVVDYFLVPNEFCDRVSNFTVGEYIPWLSDHCIINTTILMSDPLKRITTQKMNPIDLHPGFKWDEISTEKFQESLMLPYFKSKFEALLNSVSLKPSELAQELKSILLENTEIINVKVKKTQIDQNSEAWFDTECKKLKNEVRSLGNKLRKAPKDPVIRMSLFAMKKSFKRTILSKKRNYKTKVLSDLDAKRQDGNQKEFWKIFRKISPKNKRETVRPSLANFFQYFKDLSNSPRPQDTPPTSNINGPLDFEISPKELEDACKKIKMGKACGFDSICNEMIIGLANTHPKILLKLFNDILQSNEVIPDWVSGMIVPLHKDGPKLNTSNYRGITLISCLGKVFLAILNNRLMEYSINHNLLSPAQLGFMPGNRTSDAHIIIHNIVQNVCHINGEKVFSCFVDFKKAFDSIPRDILLKKLINFGVNGKFFNILRHIYTSDKACIKLDNSRSAFFELNLGVRQGCILSPLLFNLFLSDLAKKFEAMDGKFQLGQTGINSLFWADDLVLFAKSKVDLENLLKTLEVYCKDNELLINAKKTKCMIFNKTGRLIRNYSFYLDGKKLDMVRSYKYLGFLVTPSGEIGSGLKDLRDRALKAFMKLKNDLGVSFNQDVVTSLSLLDTLIKPILLYASDFWGALKLPKDDPIEKFHRMMYKQLLGVQKQTTGIGVLLELGRVPLSLFAIKNSVKNWERIRRGYGNKLLVNAYKGSELSWDMAIKNILESNGMLNFYLNIPTNIHPFVYKKLFQRLNDSFHQNAFEMIKSETSKLRTYALFKTEIGLENYLFEIKNVAVRVHVTKFRLSNHRLMIETGRHTKNKKDDKIPKEKRFCPFCPRKIENEFHFIFECPIYTHLRSRHLEGFFSSIYGFSFLPNDSKMRMVLSNLEYDTCKFIADSTELRTFLMSKPKVHD